MSKDWYRPRLPDMLRDKITQEYKINNEEKPLYVIAGYTSKREFINQAIKEKIEREKQKLEENSEDNKSDKDSSWSNL